MYNDQLVYKVVIWAFVGIRLWTEKVALMFRKGRHDIDATANKLCIFLGCCIFVGLHKLVFPGHFKPTDKLDEFMPLIKVSHKSHKFMFTFPFVLI